MSEMVAITSRTVSPDWGAIIPSEYIGKKVRETMTEETKAPEGLEYVGTAYGTRVYVGPPPAIVAAQDGNGATVGVGITPEIWRHDGHDARFWKKVGWPQLAVTPAVLAVLDEWVEWDPMSMDEWRAAGWARGLAELEVPITALTDSPKAVWRCASYRFVFSGSSDLPSRTLRTSAKVEGQWHGVDVYERPREWDIVKTKSMWKSEMPDRFRDKWAWAYGHKDLARIDRFRRSAVLTPSAEGQWAKEADDPNCPHAVRAPTPGREAVEEMARRGHNAIHMPPKHVDPDDYEGLGFWGTRPAPDPRSTELLSVETTYDHYGDHGDVVVKRSRVVLHLDESETHTGLLPTYKERVDQWEAACVLAAGRFGKMSHAIVLAIVINDADNKDEAGWPVDRQALHDAVMRLNLALSWKENGTKGAQGGEADASTTVVLAKAMPTSVSTGEVLRIEKYDGQAWQVVGDVK